MWHLAVSPLELVARSAIVYVAFLAALRLFGKREIGQFTFFDLALILLAANALQPAMTGPDSSIPGGLVILVTVFGLNRIIAALRERSPLVRRLLESKPTVIGRNGHWLHDALDREGLDESDGDAALREHGFATVEEIELAVLEPDGTISVIGKDGGRATQARHRGRYRGLR